ncbi:MAG: hypothetical protein WCM76_09155 [Bacteroidota bacterium]
MKKIFLLAALMSAYCCANAQYNVSINFEDTATLKYVRIDTANHTNIWQIGKPSKIVFDSAYSATDAILTDTALPYPVNNHSSFTITIKSYDWFWGSPSWHGFYSKYDTDPGHDGGYIDVSYDGGANWQNIVFDTILNTCPTYPFSDSLPTFYNMYTATDTLKNGVPAFSGSSIG